MHIPYMGSCLLLQDARFLENNNRNPSAATQGLRDKIRSNKFVYSCVI